MQGRREDTRLLWHESQGGRGEIEYLRPVTLGVDFTVTGKPDVSVFLPTEQLVTIGDFCFAVLSWKG